MLQVALLCLLTCAAAPAQRPDLESLRVELRSIDSGDLDARVAWAARARAANAKADALRELDRVLQRDPDNRMALEELRRGRWVEPAPSREQAWREAGSARGALRELRLEELRRGAAADEWKRELELSLSSIIVERRLSALVGLRRAFSTQLPRAVLRCAVYDASLEVQEEAARSLRAAQDPNWILPLVRTLERDPSSSVRANAARALGRIGQPGAVEPLIVRLAAPRPAGASAGSAGARIPHSHIFIGSQRAYVQDFDVEVAAFASVADPQVNTLLEGAMLDAAVTGTGAGAVLYEQATIRTALGQLTNQRGMHTNRAWLDWWKKYGDQWKSQQAAQPQQPASASPKTNQAAR